jgi:tetraacyldisaccharide 4'-kinase
MHPRHPIVKKVERIMEREREERWPFLATCLQAVSLGYSGVVTAREAFYRKRLLQSQKLPCSVISVGNLTMGGTGKTPMTICVADLLRGIGYRVVILSRGYHGRAEKKGGVVSDGRHLLMGPDDAGDEPFMMAASLRDVPVIVGRNRYAAGMLAHERFAPDVVVLDDGFQHLRLFRDLDLVLLDRCRPLGNGHLFPRGPLRETASALGRADACIFTRGDLSTPMDTEDVPFLPHGLPLFTTSHLPQVYRFTGGGDDPPRRWPHGNLERWEPKRLKDRSVYAFSGIANNDEFRQSVENLCGEVKGFCPFPDHYRYSDADLRRLLRKAEASRADTLVTTEKDFARIGHRLRWAMELVVIGITTFFGNETAAFCRFLRSRL